MGDEYGILSFENDNEHIYNNNTNHDDSSADYFFINSAFILLIFISFATSTCCKYNVVRNERNERNERLLRNHILSSENNSENIEKIEVKYDNNFYDKECTICLEGFVENELLYKLKCHHYYHKNCIDDWLSKKNTCPLCRLNLL